MSKAEIVETLMDFQNQLILGIANAGTINKVRLRKAIMKVVEVFSEDDEE